MTPIEMARIHALAFVDERPWSASEFENLLTSKLIFAVDAPGGFALIRVVLDEAELLSIAVDPSHHRQGIAQTLMARWVDRAQKAGATRAFLEVASDNIAARTLYEKHSFAEISLRKAYYTRKGAPAADAIIMQRRLTRGQGA